MIVNSHFPHLPSHPGVQAQVCVALTQDERGLYAAYIGIVMQCDDSEAKRAAADWVATRGSKLPWRDAATHFPQIPEQKYRA